MHRFVLSVWIVAIMLSATAEADNTVGSGRPIVEWQEPPAFVRSQDDCDQYGKLTLKKVAMVQTNYSLCLRDYLMCNQSEDGNTKVCSMKYCEALDGQRKEFQERRDKGISWCNAELTKLDRRRANDGLGKMVEEIHKEQRDSESAARQAVLDSRQAAREKKIQSDPVKTPQKSVTGGECSIFDDVQRSSALDSDTYDALLKKCSK